MTLQISVRTGQPLEVEADVAVVGVFTLASSKKANALIEALDRALGGGVASLVQAEDFTGKDDTSISFSTLGKAKARRLVILGLGDKPAFDVAAVRTFASRAAREADKAKASSLVVALPEGAEKHLREVAEGLELGAYRFAKYLTGERKPKTALTSVTVLVPHKPAADAKRAVEIGQRVGAAVNVARDLSNEPPNAMYPAALAEAAVRAGKEHKFSVTVFDDKEILKRGMYLLHAVGRGSAHGPRLVHMAYVPAKKGKKRIVFVGKGITFDTGGISIKPSAGMEAMKHDMSGAANMVGLMAAVAATKPPVEVHALMACAENMPDGNAYRPGDVWGSYSGKTVEIVNTDAEGRLILADALTYAARDLQADVIVDNATLTGACVVALGNTCSGWYASNEDIARRFATAVKDSGERMWRMPLLEELKDQLKSDVADVKHTGDRWGGSITAALFLREFIGDVKDWIHADIAGPAAADKAYAWYGKGATGHGVLTFLALVDRLAR
jgi:leucyl aminopeptidase